MDAAELLKFMIKHVVEMDASSFLIFCNAFKEDLDLFRYFAPTYSLCLMDPDYVVRFKLSEEGLECIEIGYLSDFEWKLKAAARVSFGKEGMN